MSSKEKSIGKIPNRGEMMLPKLRFPGFEGEWEAIKLNEISEKVTKKNTSNSLDLVFSNSAVYGLVLQSEYFDKSIANKNNLQGYYIVKPYDFVYNPRISSNAEVGAMSVNNTSKTGLVSPLYTVFRISTDKVSCQFLEVLFKSKVWHNVSGRPSTSCLSLIEFLALSQRKEYDKARRGTAFG